jgi:hypothetical protein
MLMTLRFGRTVSIAELHQWRTYAGLLAGRPDASTNQGRIGTLLDEARRFGVAEAQPYLIRPTVTIKEWESKGMAMREERLPAVSCIAVLVSDGLARKDSEPYSSLTIVWFQDKFALPIAPEIYEKIRAIDWETHARDWCW